MFKKDNVVRVKPPLSELDKQLLNRQIKKVAPKPVKAKRVDRDKEEYFRAVFYCPVCGEFLASYTYGRAWADNGLSEDRRINCPTCNLEIDWSDVLYPPAKED